MGLGTAFKSAFGGNKKQAAGAVPNQAPQGVMGKVAGAMGGLGQMQGAMQRPQLEAKPMPEGQPPPQFQSNLMGLGQAPPPQMPNPQIGAMGNVMARMQQPMPQQQMAPPQQFGQQLVQQQQPPQQAMGRQMVMPQRSKKFF